MFNRGLSTAMLTAFGNGSLSAFLTLALDPNQNIDFQIRDNYVNLYKNGCSLIKISEGGVHNYSGEIHAAYLAGINLGSPTQSCGEYEKFQITQTSLEAFISNLLQIMRNAQNHEGKEAVTEDLALRDSRYPVPSVRFIDRQIAMPNADNFRLDLMGIEGDGTLILTELKRYPDNSIQKVLSQLHKYKSMLCSGNTPLPEVVQSYNLVRIQKQELGLLPLSVPVITAANVKMLLLVADYNEKSTLLQLAKDNAPLNEGFYIAKRRQGNLRIASMETSVGPEPMEYFQRGN